MSFIFRTKPYEEKLSQNKPLITSRTIDSTKYDLLNLYLRKSYRFAEYGYGFLAVFIISALSLGGFVAFPLMKKPYYKYVNAFFVALAVGTLYADTAFELFPVVRIFEWLSPSFFSLESIIQHEELS